MFMLLKFQALEFISHSPLQVLLKVIGKDFLLICLIANFIILVFLGILFLREIKECPG